MTGAISKPHRFIHATIAALALSASAVARDDARYGDESVGFFCRIAAL